MRLSATHAFLVSLCFISIAWVNCFEPYELDLFDLVEDVSQNFYDLFNVKQDCSANEIRKSYRKLSMQWHPDKNKEPGAEKKFRQIAGIYEVLKDTEKRARYDQVLEFGLPDWRSPIYYYRKARKLGFVELILIIAIVLSIGHYCWMWGTYWEHKLTVADRLGDVQKKLDKEKRKGRKLKGFDYEEVNEELQNYYDSIPTPSFRNALPCRFAKFTWYALVNIPFWVKDGLLLLLKPKPAKPAVVDKKETPPKKAPPSPRSLGSSLNPKRIEKSDIKETVITYELKKTLPNQSEQDKQAATNTNKKEWTDKERADLIKAIAKYPAGVVSRWTTIAAFVGRSEQDCIQMDKQMRTNFNATTHSSLNATSWLQRLNIVRIKEEPTIKIDETSTTENNNLLIDGNWTQESQTLFEKALKDFGKDCPNRWEKIASCVPNKTKEECVERFKILCEALKKKQ